MQTHRIMGSLDNVACGLSRLLRPTTTHNTLKPSRTDTPNPSPANSSSCISGNFQREAPLSKCFCTNAAREAGVSASTARFHAEAKGNTGGLTLSRVHVVPLTNQRNHIGPAPMKTCSAAAPVLPPEYTVFNTAIGRIDAPAAAKAYTVPNIALEMLPACNK